MINFRGGADRSIRTPTYSFFDLEYSEEQIQAGVKPKIDPSVFKDKAVFVGATGSGLCDVFQTPFATGSLPGIQIHAAVVDDILSQSLHVRGVRQRPRSRRCWSAASASAWRRRCCRRGGRPR